MRHDDPQHANRPQWHQINIQFDGHDVSERNAIAHLGPELKTAESTGLLTSWFFIRKQWWRFRYMLASSTSGCEGKKLLEDAARFMQDSGYASQWVENISEPETHAFGGEEGMTAAHNLFHQDSRHIFEHLRPLGDRPLKRPPFSGDTPPTWTTAAEFLDGILAVVLTRGDDDQQIRRYAETITREVTRWASA